MHVALSWVLSALLRLRGEPAPLLCSLALLLPSEERPQTGSDHKIEGQTNYGRFSKASEEPAVLASRIPYSAKYRSEEPTNSGENAIADPVERTVDQVRTEVTQG